MVDVAQVCVTGHVPLAMLAPLTVYSVSLRAPSLLPLGIPRDTLIKSTTCAKVTISGSVNRCRDNRRQDGQPEL
jgi:hypothetical protein